MKKLLVSGLLALSLIVAIPYVAAAKIKAHAKCWDNTYSYSLNRRGTCSHHGGVRYWYW